MKRCAKELDSLEEAITAAIRMCAADGILADILTKQYMEVLAVLLETFDKELYEKNLKQEAWEEGRESMAIGMYDNNLSIEIIAQVAKTTVEQVTVWLQKAGRIPMKL